MRQRGTVLDFANGFGWIQPDEMRRRVFVHWSGIEIGSSASGYRELHAGDVVEFQFETNERGTHAAQVKVIQYAEVTA